VVEEVPCSVLVGAVTRIVGSAGQEVITLTTGNIPSGFSQPCPVPVLHQAALLIAHQTREAFVKLLEHVPHGSVSIAERFQEFC
jgi:hypothetical protein